MFLVNIETPIGTNLYKTDSIARYAEQVVLAPAEDQGRVQQRRQRQPRVYYNEIQRTRPATTRSSSCAWRRTRRARSRRQRPARFVPRLSDARIEVKQFETGSAHRGAHRHPRLRRRPRQPARAASRVEELLKSTENTLRQQPAEELHHRPARHSINTDKAALLGIPTSEIDKTVRMGLARLGIATPRDEEGEDYTINATLSGATSTRSFRAG